MLPVRIGEGFVKKRYVNIPDDGGIEAFTKATEIRLSDASDGLKDIYERQLYVSRRMTSADVEDIRCNGQKDILVLSVSVAKRRRDIQVSVPDPLSSDPVPQNSTPDVRANPRRRRSSNQQGNNIPGEWKNQ